MDSSNYFLSHSSLSYHHQSPHHDCCNARPSEPNAALTSAPLLIFCPFGHIFMHTGMFTQCYYFFFFALHFLCLTQHHRISEAEASEPQTGTILSVYPGCYYKHQSVRLPAEIWGGLNPGRTTYSLYDLGWIFSPLCALVSSFIKGE